MNPFVQRVMNTTSVVFAIGVNYYSQAFGINGNTVGSISNRYDNLFTPAGYAFSIWGIIFLMLVVYVIFQMIKRKDQYVVQYFIASGSWFATANFLNGLWVIVWLYEWTGLSVLIMSGLLFSLLKVLLSMRQVPSSLVSTICMKIPIHIYTGWITVAIVANSAAYLAKIEWTGAPLSEEAWTLVMILVAVLINIFILLTLQIRSYVLVAIWALLAISNKQAETFEPISNFAVWCSVVLSVLVVVSFFWLPKNLKLSGQ